MMALLDCPTSPEQGHKSFEFISKKLAAFSDKLFVEK